MAEQTRQEASAEVWRLFRETREQFKETDARFKETDAMFKETARRINQISGLFTSQWGKLIEALVEPNALKLFQERGIAVHYASQRVKSQRNGRTMELDLLLENDEIALVVEAKSTLEVGDVQDFMADMAEFLTFFPRYQTRQVYGAVARLDIAAGVDRYAYRQGLFVLAVVGEGVVQIKNDDAFQPKNFVLLSNTGENG